MKTYRILGALCALLLLATACGRGDGVSSDPVSTPETTTTTTTQGEDSTTGTEAPTTTAGATTGQTTEVQTTAATTTKVTTIAKATTTAAVSEPVVDTPDWTKYTIGCFIHPVWEGNTVYNETLMFVPNAKTGKIDPAPLLYKPDKVLEVRSADLSKLYKEGADYTVTADGRIALTENTRIPTWAYDEYYCKTYESFGLPSLSATGRYLKYAEGNTFLKTQVCVTYTHSDKWDGYVPEYAGDVLKNTVAKLKAGKPLSIVYNGDSIAEGCNASGWLKIAPFVPNWTQMVTQELQAVYDSNILTKNTAVGGKTAEWGLENVQDNIIRYVPDLVVLRFGTNDATQGVTSSQFKQRMAGIIEAVRKARPECEFILVANTLSNPDVGAPWTNRYHTENQAALLELAEEYDGVAVARMLDVESTLLKTKRYWDMTGNNINHYNDFMTRVQASVVAQLLVEDL